MTRDLTKWISLIFSALVMSMNLSAKDAVDEQGNFVDPKDQSLVFYQLETFARECTFVTSTESKLLEQLNANFRKINSRKEAAVYSCYENTLPKMKSIVYLYGQICKALTYKGVPGSQSKLLSQFVSVNEYKDGVSLHHVILNDCLGKANAESKWVVPLSSGNSLASGLEKGLRSMDTDLPFFPNRLEIR